MPGACLDKSADCKTGDGDGPLGDVPGCICCTKFTTETAEGVPWGGGVGEAGFVIIVGLAFRKLITGSPEEECLP